MTTADYLVLLLVFAAYLGWIFQGEHEYKPHKPTPKEELTQVLGNSTR